MTHHSSRTSSRAARRAKLRVRLHAEALEARLVPAVIGINAAANVHAIDPNVYGTAFASTTQLADLRIPLNRDGGNSSDTYSFTQDANNHANDWFFESIPLGTGNGQGIDSFIQDNKTGGAQSSITLNLFDYAAKLGASRSDLGSFSVAKYGPQQSTDPWHSNWGNGVHTDGTNVTGNKPSDAYLANSPTIEQAWIQHLLSTFGNSNTGGVQYYTLGNEPGLWNSTHRDIHPAGDTLPELLSRSISYASLIKSLDPGAKILGPEEWGWTNYFISGADAAAQNWSATYNGMNAEAWLLDQFHQHDAATGQRLLDYFTLHFYPQGGQFSDDVSTSMELLRNRSTRSLWDPNYTDESWIASTGINSGKVNLINLMKSWVNTEYPGTKIGITEYNWGAEGNMNGATTQADIWGIFGREGLDLANRWTTPATGSPTYLAMKMFRNYDGNGAAFGDTSVSASVANPDQVDAFSSVRSSDGALTVMVINKDLYDPSNPSATTPITIDLSNFAGGATAQEWQLAAIDPTNQNNAAITQLSDVALGGNRLTVTVPRESISLFVIRPASRVPIAPTNLTATAVSSTHVNLTWTNQSTNQTAIVVEQATDSSFTSGLTTVNLGATATSYSATGLSVGTTYWFRVRATNASGASAYSTGASATTLAPGTYAVGAFHGAGVWRHSPSGWQQLTTAEVTQVAVDAYGDVAVEIPNYGVWRFEDTTGWQWLTPVDATQVAIAGNGIVAVEFAGYGIWRFQDASGWQRLTTADATQIALNTHGDVAAEIPHYGVWRFQSTVGWLQLTPADATQVALDAAGDVAVEISGYGVWRFRNTSGWQQLTTADVTQLAMGGNGDVAVEVAGYGVWHYRDAFAWQQLLTTDASLLAMSLSGDVAAEIPGAGMWLYPDGLSGSQLTSGNAFQIGLGL